MRRNQSCSSATLYCDWLTTYNGGLKHANKKKTKKNYLFYHCLKKRSPPLSESHWKCFQHFFFPRYFLKMSSKTFLWLWDKCSHYCDFLKQKRCSPFFLSATSTDTLLTSGVVMLQEGKDKVLIDVMTVEWISIHETQVVAE